MEKDVTILQSILEQDPYLMLDEVLRNSQYNADSTFGDMIFKDLTQLLLYTIKIGAIENNQIFVTNTAIQYLFQTISFGGFQQL